MVLTLWTFITYCFSIFLENESTSIFAESQSIQEDDGQSIIEKSPRNSPRLFEEESHVNVGDDLQSLFENSIVYSEGSIQDLIENSVAEADKESSPSSNNPGAVDNTDRHIELITLDTISQQIIQDSKEVPAYSVLLT